MAKLKSTYVIGGLIVEGPIIASQFATIGGEGNVTVSSNIANNANIIPKFQTSGAFSVVKSTISDMVVSGESSHLRLGNAGGTDPVVLEFWRGAAASSWDIRNAGGNLIFRNNYVAAAGPYFDVLTLNYNTGNATIKGSLSVGGKAVVSSTGLLAASQLSGTIPAAVTQTEWDTAYTDTSSATSANTASKIVKRDANGDFSARTITASLTGNAGSATKLATSRKINSVNFDGTADITITAAASTLTGNTLASGVTKSSLTSVGTIASGTWSATDVGLAHGGTNASLTAVNGGVVYSTSSAMAITAAGTSGQFLKSNGAAAPTWATPTDTNYYPTTFAWTAGSTSGPTGSLTGSGMSSVAFGAIPAAAAGASGIVTTGAQTFAGAKTFNSTINGLTLAAAATGFTIAGGTTSKTLTIGVASTIGAASTYTGAVTIISGGTSSTTIIGPNNGTATLVGGTMVPDTRKVAGMALSSDITLKTLTINSTTAVSSVTIGSYTGSSAATITIFKPNQDLNTTSSPTFKFIYSKIACLVPADQTTYALTTAALHLYSPSSSANHHNTAAGYGALFYLNPTSTINGSYNSAFGSQSLYPCSTGSSNSAFGANSLDSCTTGSYNTALGYNAGSSVSTQQNTLCLGSDTGIDISAGDYQMNFNNRVRYFEFPKGTQRGTIFTALQPYFTVDLQYVSCIGSYAPSTWPGIIRRITAAEFFIYNTNSDLIDSFIQNSTTTTTDTLQLQFVVPQ